MVAKRRLLARVRKAAGYTQESLAERLGIDRTTVARWEAGTTAPQPWQRPKLAELLGISQHKVEELLGETVSTIDAALLTGLPESTPEAAIAETPRGVSSADSAAREELVAWLTRRLLLKYGIAATTLPLLGADWGAAGGIPMPATPLVASWASRIYEAVLGPTDAARLAAATPATRVGHSRGAVLQLRHAVQTAVQASLSSDYGGLARTLPRLIGDVELTALTADEADQASIQRFVSDIYALAGWTLIKADSPAVAWIAAQRAVQAAEQADDVPRQAAATRCLSEVYMRARSFEEASRTAFLAATYLDGSPVKERMTAQCLRGAAFLSAAAASARRGDQREAHAALKAAAMCATELNEERCELATVFGPTNVAIHKVAVALELGDIREASRHIPKVSLDRMPGHLTERRARYLVDVARTYAGFRNDDAALDALLQAEQIAPDELRHHRLTHSVLRDLLTRERRSSELRALADRCKVLA